jgi:leucyl/phenylalanyl-tRNA---protein transferase
MLPWLTTPHFPPAHQALDEPNGLLAASETLSPAWLLAAYRQGIFPWYMEGEPVLWWSPDPRMVLFPSELRLTRSLRKRLIKGDFEVRCDTAFAAVMAGCAAPRDAEGLTWIGPLITQGYCQLHEQGWAHSVETWLDDELVGGLYGVAIGRVFYGESMFHRVTDASKVAFAHLARGLLDQGYTVIDCQMSTPHLASLGGREIGRDQFLGVLERWTGVGVSPARWPANTLQRDWRAAL